MGALRIGTNLLWLGRWGFIFLTGGLFLFLLGQLPVQYSDLHYFFYPAVKTWLNGYSPYQVEGFFNPPWTLFLLLPLALLSEHSALAVMALFSVIAIFLTAQVYRAGRLLLLGALMTPATISLLLLGQVDAWIILGVSLGIWALKRQVGWAMGLALALVLVKPQIGGLVALLWLWKMPKQMRLSALASLGGIWAISSFVIGTWWPLGIPLTSPIGFSNMNVSTLAAVKGIGLPPSIYLLLALSLLAFWGILICKRSSDQYTIALSILIAALASPYVARHSMSAAMATAFIYVGRHSWPTGLVVYILTWIPLLGIWKTPWPGWWEASAWWSLLAGLLLSMTISSPDRGQPARIPSETDKQHNA